MRGGALSCCFIAGLTFSGGAALSEEWYPFPENMIECGSILRGLAANADWIKDTYQLGVETEQLLISAAKFEEAAITTSGGKKSSEAEKRARLTPISEKLTIYWTERFADKDLFFGNLGWANLCGTEGRERNIIDLY